MDEDKGSGLGVSPSTEGVSSEDRERAHREHTRIVEGAAKANAPEPTDAEVIADATDRHHEEVVKPSLLPKPNSTDPDAPPGVPEDEDEH